MTGSGWVGYWADRSNMYVRAGVTTGDCPWEAGEKPARPPSPFSCPPLYILEPQALARLPEFLREAPDADAPGTLIAWLAAREPVFAHEMRGRRLDVGDVESYRRAEAWLAEVEGEAS